MTDQTNTPTATDPETEADEVVDDEAEIAADIAEAEADYDNAGFDDADDAETDTIPP